MIIFLRPQYLLLLLLIPIVIFIHINSLRTARRKAIKFANFEAIRKIDGVELFSKNLTVLYINILILVLIVLSISGVSITQQVDASSLSFVLAIDNSGSMAANDIAPTRIDAAKRSAIDFLKMVPEKTRIGVLSFSSNIVVGQEVTDDKQLITNAINGIALSSAGGTDVLNALITSSNLLVGENSRAIILMSDGDLNLNSLQEVLDYANKNRITIHTLGIGTLAGGNDSSGATYKLSEDTLKLIAKTTGGKYYPISQLSDFYYSLGNIIEVTKQKEIKDISYYLLLAALILLIIDFYFINNRFRIFP